MGPSKQSDATGAFAAREKVERLLKAARDGDLTAFKEAAKVIREGHDVATAVGDVKDGNERGPLHFAARGGKDEICKYLLEELHFPVDPLDNEGETPLLHAARSNFISTVKYLIDHGADPKAVSQDLGTSAMHHAAAAGSLELIKLLLEKGVNVDSPSSSGAPLIWAAGHGRLKAAELLLERGANSNSTNEDGATPLLTAAAAQFPDIVELLVKNGADVNVVAGGVAPLHIAAELGDMQMLKCLLAAGANPDATDDSGITPLQSAAISGHRTVVEHLLSVTSRIASVSEWTVDGLIIHAEQLAAEQEAAEKRDRESHQEEKANSGEKPIIIEVSPENKERALEAKARGDQAFRKKNFMDAVDNYTQALDLDPTNFHVLSNRSLCWIRLGQAEQALVDAQATRKLAPNWVKSYYREGAALRLLQRFDEAADAFYSGVKVDPDNQDVIDAFKEAVEAGKKFHGTD